MHMEWPNRAESFIIFFPMRRAFSAISALFAVLLAACSESFTDPRDGQAYDVVKIGDRVWFAENLNFASERSVCPEGDNRNCDKYGRLYTWDDARVACPGGWHLPDSAEYASLVVEAGGAAQAGESLKATSGWFKKGNGTDALEFCAEKILLCDSSKLGVRSSRFFADFEKIDRVITDSAADPAFISKLAQAGVAVM